MIWRSFHHVLFFPFVLSFSYFFQEHHSYDQKESLDQEVIDRHRQESRYQLLNAQLVGFTHELCLTYLMVGAIVVKPVLFPVYPLFEGRNRSPEKPFDDESKETSPKGAHEEYYCCLVWWTSFFCWIFLQLSFYWILLVLYLIHWGARLCSLLVLVCFPDYRGDCFDESLLAHADPWCWWCIWVFKI